MLLNTKKLKQHLFERNRSCFGLKYICVFVYISYGHKLNHVTVGFDFTVTAVFWVKVKKNDLNLKRDEYDESILQNATFIFSFVKK